MTSPISSAHASRLAPRAAASPAFTLIELILVMALLSIVFGLTFPTLQRFFHGRVLDSEARRLLALTRYGHSRAVSDGVPMVLWIDERQGFYGLETSVTYTDDDPKALALRLDDDLTIEVSTPPVVDTQLATLTWTVRTLAQGASNLPSSRVPAIRFLPDGFIDRLSPEYVELRQGRDDAVWLVQTTNRLTYELRAQQPARLRFEE